MIHEDLIFVGFNRLKGKDSGRLNLAFQTGTSSQVAASQFTTTGVHT